MATKEKEKKPQTLKDVIIPGVNSDGVKHYKLASNDPKTGKWKNAVFTENGDFFYSHGDTPERSANFGLAANGDKMKVTDSVFTTREKTHITFQNHNAIQGNKPDEMPYFDHLHSIVVRKENAEPYKAIFDAKGKVVELTDLEGTPLEPTAEVIKEAETLRAEAINTAAKTYKEETKHLREAHDKLRGKDQKELYDMAPGLYKKNFLQSSVPATTANIQQALDTARTV